MVEISTSILSVEKGKEAEVFFALEKAKTDYFHIDVMDGKFVEKDTYQKMVEYSNYIKRISNLPLDVHLMVENVKDAIEDFSAVEPNIITFHLEACKTKEEVMDRIKQIKENGSRVGIAIKPETNIEEIYEYLPYIHTCLVMTVEPGKGGQTLITDMLAKISTLKAYVEKNNIETICQSRKVYQEGSKFQQIKKYKEAISILESFQKKYPDFRDLYFLEALYKMECGKFSEAKESLLKYLNTDYSFYIFPDNNYEESYNMGILLRDIRKSSVSSPKNLLSVLFLDGSYDDTLLLGIQSVNEIASEVLVCLPYSSVIDRNIIENYGANIINIENINGEEALIKGLKNCSGKFILILKSREFISKDLFAPLVNFLETTNDDFCNVLVSDKSQVPQLRLLRNTNKIKNMKNINDFYKVLENQNIQTYDININKA